jgi:hypothetical protein
MKKIIWKFPINTDLKSWIELPGRNAKPIHVNFDGDSKLCLWAEVTPEDVYIKRAWIDIVGTGHELLTDTGTYINTFMRNEFVFHAYYTLS